MAVITDEEESTAVRHIDLHSDQACRMSDAPPLQSFWSRLTISVPRQVVQCNALAEIEISLVEGFPIPGKCQRARRCGSQQNDLQAQLEIVLQVNANVRSGCDRPEGRPQFSVVHPDFDILTVQKFV